MDTRQKRNLLHAGSALNFVSAFIILCASFFSTSTQARIPGESLPKTTPAAARVFASIDSLEPLFQVKLQRPVTESQIKSANKPQFAGKLIGTAISASSNQAMFQLSSGQVELKSTGEEIAGARIEEIKENSVKLIFQGEFLTLTVDQGAGQ